MAATISAILFDLDDTLHDFTPSERAARSIVCERVARRFGLDAAELTAIYREINGRNIFECERDRRFWSSTIQAYREGVWAETLRAFGIHPERSVLTEISAAYEAFMIGDSLRNDIAGAQSAGCLTLWLNRNGEALPAEIRPTWTARSLDKVPVLLEEALAS